MSPAPVTRDCGCSPDHLCPKAQGLRDRVNETCVDSYGYRERSPEERRAIRRNNAAVKALKRHTRGVA